MEELKIGNKDEVAKRLARIATGAGTITPEMVVDDARDPESPLHKHFEWDDEIAASAYRIDKARAIIRSVKVVVKNERIVVLAPAYIRDPEAPTRSQGYIHVNTLKDDVESAKDALLREFRSVSVQLARAKALASVLGLEDEIGKLLEMVGGMEIKARGARIMARSYPSFIHQPHQSPTSAPL